jgi:L-type amino acid transporter 9
MWQTAVKVTQLIELRASSYFLPIGHTEYLANGFDGTEGNLGKIALGLYNGMWAYDGW